MQAQQNIFESSQKLDLIRHSLEVHRTQLPPESSIAGDLKAELESAQAMSPPVGGSTFSALSGEVNTASLQSANSLESSSNNGPPQRPPRASQVHRNSVFSRVASVTGKLEVRLMGCQDLLDDVPGRSRKGEQQNSVFSSPTDLKSFMKGVTRSSSKSYNIKDETSSEF